MADTLTTNLRLTNQTSGGNNGSWGTIADTNFEEIDDKFGDTTSVSTTGGTTTLTEEQERVAVIDVSGTLVSNSTVVFSGRGGFWIIRNGTTGAFSVTAKVSGQTGVSIAQGTATLVWCNGTDIIAGVPTAEVAADTTPQLGGDLDANSFSIGFDDGTGIEDDAGNEQLRFQKTATAVNQIDVTNAATGGSPRFDATGDDTNIDLTLAGKGTGGVVGNFKNATGLGILDSDGSHALKVSTSSNLTAERTLTLVPGDADRTVTLSGNLTVSGAATVPAGTALVAGNNLSDVSTAATAFTNIKQAASDTATGVVEIAVQAEMEAASDTGRAVVPGRQHFHPGHPKAGGTFNGQGTPAFASGDYGMGAITDGGTGNYTLNLDTAFDTTNFWYAVAIRSDTNGAGANLNPPDSGAKTNSTLEVEARYDQQSIFDPIEACITFWGDYA